MSNSASSAYFAAIRTEKTKLDERFPDGFLYTISIGSILKNSTPGCVAEMSTALAARQIVEAVARPATPEEIEAFKQKGAQFTARMQAEGVRRNPALGQTIIMPSREAK